MPTPPRACSVCCYTGPELYCPKCRARGKVVMLKTREQLQSELNRMRVRAETIKAAMRAIIEREG